MWPAGASRGPCMNELQLSHSEFTICCSARVPGRCQTREVELMLVTASSQVLLVFFFITIYPHSFRLFFSWSLFAKPEGGWSFYWHGQLLGQDKKWPEIKSSWKRKKNLIHTIYFNDSLALLLKWKTQIEQMTSCTRANVKTTRSSWKIAENMQTPHAYSNYRTRLNSTAFEFASQRNFLTSICGCMPNMVVKILD